MLRRPTLRRFAVIAVALAAVFATMFAPPASAHAELLQSSPRVNSVVGGEFHSIALQFGGLDPTAEFRADLLDPAGQPIGAPPVSEDSRIVIPIDPLVTPGSYTVSYTTVGADGDVTSETFTFRFDPSADEPEGITIEFGTQERIGLFGWVMVCVAAGLLGYLVHRFMFALRAHRAYKRGVDQASVDQASADQASASDEPADASA